MTHLLYPLTPTPRPRRRWATAAALAAAVALGGTAFARSHPALPSQSGGTLNLEGVPPLPHLRGESVSIQVASTLEQEISELERPPAAVADALLTSVRSARLELRRLARLLLVKSDAGGPASDAAALHGFRLADLRRRVDLRLERAVEGTGLTLAGESRPLGVRERDRIQRLLARFAEVAPKALGSARLDDIVQLDSAMSVALEPLIDAIAITESMPTGDDLGSGWPTKDELAALGVASGIGALPAHGAAPTMSLAIDPCDPIQRESIQGEVGPATWNAIERLCGRASEAATDGNASPIDLMDAAMRLSMASKAASWLDANARADLDQRAAALAEGRGDRGLAKAKASLVAARTRLGAAATESNPPAELDRVLRSLLFLRDDGSSDGSLLPVALAQSPRELTRVIERVADSIQIAVAARTGEATESAKEWKAPLRDARRRYDKAETATWAKLPGLLADEDSLTNPEYTGLVRAQREAFRDIDRVLGAQKLIDSIGGVRPQAARGLGARVHAMVRWLNEPPRRDDATLAYDTLELHVTLFLPMPFERDLREPTDEALTFTAGRTNELVRAVDEARSAWADAWAEGAATGTAAKRLVLLHRLLRTMEDLSRGGGPSGRDAVGSLSRWGAFHATKASLAPAMVDMTAMAQLATTSAIKGDDEKLARDLDRIDRDAPLARLVGQLSRDLEPWLAKRPGDILGQLVAIREAPRGDAWGIALRSRLAAILRAARELDAARRGNRDEDEKALLEHLSGLARTALESIPGEPSPLLTLPALPTAEEPAEKPQRSRRRGS